PTGVGLGQHGSLGRYYNQYNGTETHVPESEYPFSRVEYYPDPLNRTKRTAAAGEHFQLGSGHEGKVFYLDHAGELAYLYGANVSHYANYYQPIASKKTVTIDAEGVERVVYRDKAGLTLASCFSGLDDSCLPQEVRRFINTNSERNFVDLHLPEDAKTAGAFKLIFNTPPFWEQALHSSANAFSIMDLDSYTMLSPGDFSIDSQTGVVTFNNPTYQTGSSFLRVFFDFPQAYLDKIDDYFQTWTRPPGFFPHQEVHYQLDYSQWTINYFDVAGNLVKNIPPEGISCDSYDPSLFMDDVFQTKVEAMCTNCAGGAQPTNGNYIFQNLPPLQEVCSTTVSTLGVGQDHELHFQIEPVHFYIPRSQDYCDYFDQILESVDHQLDFALDNEIYEVQLPGTGGTTRYEGMTARRTPPEIMNQATARAKRMDASILKSYGDGDHPAGEAEPWWSLLDECENQGCDLCLHDDMGWAWTQTQAAHGCAYLGKVVKEIRHIPGPLPGIEGFFCVECGDTHPCLGHDGSFMVQFRIKVELWGSNGGVLQNQLSVGPQYVESALNFRECDCSIKWDPNMTVMATGTVPNADLDLYDEVVIKVTDVQVARYNAGNFTSFSPGNFRDEFLRKMALRFSTTYSIMPAGNQPG
ncbi:MAG: hypothetical protein AAGB22_08365, partial [Bacteroidota bacterium]